MEEKEIFRGGCPHCPQTEDNLALDTVLYNGFGGYSVIQNGNIFYMAELDKEWEDFKTLADIEKEIPDNSTDKWEVILNNLLRGATWERKHKGHWILTETNQGFA